MQALLLINRESRSGAEHAGQVRDALRRLDVSVVVRDADSPTDIEAALASHADTVDRVVIGGGDGTISMAVEALMDCDLPIGLVPLGTANDLARTLSIPLDMHAACRVAVEGRAQAVDVGQCNDVYFVNVGSLGIPVRASKYRSTAAKHWLGALGYAGNIIQAFRDTEPFDAELTWGEHRKSVHSIQIVVGNGRYFGGGMAVARDAAPDDGNLDIYSLAPQTSLEMLRKLPGLVRGPDQSLAGVSLFKAAEVRVTTREPMAINTDGEMLTSTPADFRVITAALRIMVPAARCSPVGDDGASNSDTHT